MNTASATKKFYYQDREVRVIARDSDPRATVWICFVDDPDRSVFANPTEVIAR